MEASFYFWKRIRFLDSVKAGYRRKRALENGVKNGAKAPLNVSFIGHVNRDDYLFLLKLHFPFFCAIHRFKIFTET